MFSDLGLQTYVFCRSCGRWCLSPIEERWEALEEAERIFRQTTTRLSTGNIGLARVAEGLELVRIGKPLRPEFAAWRYGDLLRNRMWRSSVVPIGATLALLGTTLATFPNPQFAALNAVPITQLGHTAFDLWRRRGQVVVKVQGENDAKLRLTRLHISRTALMEDEQAGWALSLAYRAPRDGIRFDKYTLFRHDTSSVTLRGTLARQALTRIMPGNNEQFGGKQQVSSAVHFIEGLSRIENPFEGIIKRVARRERWYGDTEVGRLSIMPAEMRLALEMVLHEDDERRALEGELEELQRAWEDAEEVARIADDERALGLKT